MMSPISSTGKMVGFGMTLLVSLGLLFGRVSFWPNNMSAPSCCVVMLVMFLFLLFEVAPLGFFLVEDLA